MTVIVYRMLSNVEKEKLVIDLYYNQRKNVRQIAQEARMSFRDIAAILKKKETSVNDGSSDGGDGLVKSNQKSTQAYKLYSEGYKPVEIAIQLGLPERQATKYCREYWELKGLHELTLLFEERKHYLPSFLKLHLLTAALASSAAALPDLLLI